MGAARFLSEPLVPAGEFVAATFAGGTEPLLPATFRSRDETLGVKQILRSWRSTTNDRGDTYLARHWYELVTTDERLAVVYYDRKALRGKPRWWLYTLSDL